MGAPLSRVATTTEDLKNLWDLVVPATAATAMTTTDAMLHDFTASHEKTLASRLDDARRSYMNWVDDPHRKSLEDRKNRIVLRMKAVRDEGSVLARDVDNAQRTYDALQTRLYFDGASGEYLTVRTRAWVWYDFFWRLHIMDYQGGEDFNGGLLRGAALGFFGLCAAGLGLSALALRRAARRNRRMER